MTALLSPLLQVEMLAGRFEIFGAFGVCLVLLSIAVAYLARKLDKAQSEKAKMAEKSIEALTLANKVIEDAQVQNEQLKEKMNALQVDISKNSCRYEKQ